MSKEGTAQVLASNPWISAALVFTAAVAYARPDVIRESLSTGFNMLNMVFQHGPDIARTATGIASDIASAVRQFI